MEGILDQSLVDSHLVAIPRLTALSARRLARRDLQGLGRESNRSLDEEALGASSLQQLGGDLLERVDLAARERDADAMGLLEVRSKRQRSRSDGTCSQGGGI